MNKKLVLNPNNKDCQRLDRLREFSNDRMACSISGLKCHGKHLYDLMEEVRKAFLLMNANKQRNIINLYDTFRPSLVKIIVNNDVLPFFLEVVNNYALPKKLFLKWNTVTI